MFLDFLFIKNLIQVTIVFEPIVRFTIGISCALFMYSISLTFVISTHDLHIMEAAYNSTLNISTQVTTEPAKEDNLHLIQNNISFNSYNPYL